jgi:tungstate transport system permease protein
MPDLVQASATAVTLVASLDAELISIVVLSLSVSLLATAIALAIGAPAGGALAVVSFAGRKSIVIVCNALLGLPPVVVGLVIYLLLSRTLGPSDLPGFCSRPQPWS